MTANNLLSNFEDNLSVTLIGTSEVGVHIVPLKRR